MEAEENLIGLPETFREEHFWGTVTYDLLHVYPDAARHEIGYNIRVRCDYDVRKIEEYTLKDIKPLEIEDLPKSMREMIMGQYMKEYAGPITLLGKRLYIVDGPMKSWEYKKQYELRHKEEE